MFTDADTLDLILRATLLASLCLVWVVGVVRIVGLRSFSKMTAFDFVITVAIGSLLAGAAQATSWPAFLQPTLAIAALLLVQALIARLRSRAPEVEARLQNQPQLLMRDGVMLQDALDRARVTEGDLRSKLREANVTDLSQVRAVVLEATGDVSVLHGPELSEALLQGVARNR